MAFTDPQVSQIAADISATMMRLAAIEGRLMGVIQTLQEVHHEVAPSNNSANILSGPVRPSQAAGPFPCPHFIFSAEA